MSDDQLSIIADRDERNAAQPSDVEQQILGDPNKPKTSRKESKTDRLKREQREAENYWRAQLNDPIGRRELWRLIHGTEGAHAFETKFPAGAVGFPDPYAAWYARGEQDFGLRLYHKWLSLDPVAVSKMHQEHDPRFAKAE